jgi:hypothetical protein
MSPVVESGSEVVTDGAVVRLVSSPQDIRKEAKKEKRPNIMILLHINFI